MRLEKTPEEKRGAFFFSDQSAAAPSENARRDGRSAPEKTVIVYVHNDRIGTPQKITNPSRTIVWDREQEPFGETYATPTNTTPTTHRFPGQIYDSENGLFYNNNRDYDPTLGFYIEADPLGFGGGYNLFLYAGANPTQAIDPWGLAEKEANGVIKATADYTRWPTRNPAGVLMYPVTLTADDHQTKIEAWTPYFPYFGKNPSAGKSYKDDPSMSNCLGDALLDGQYVLNQDQVPNVLSHDNWNPATGGRQKDDVNIYSRDFAIHAATSEGGPTSDLRNKFGITLPVSLSPSKTLNEVEQLPPEGTVNVTSWRKH